MLYLNISISTILVPVAVLGAIALISGIMLTVASHFFEVKNSGKIQEIIDILPGANCGGCGFPGCGAYACAIIQQGVSCNKCAPGGKEVASAISELIYQKSKDIAFKEKYACVCCSGDITKTTPKMIYRGLPTCNSAAMMYGGTGVCEYGCMGYGDCQKECVFHAIYFVKGVAVVDKEKCTGCGSCIIACPKKLIVLLECSEKPVVLCKNHNKGSITRSLCTAGCIGCGMCFKTCKFDAIKMKNNLAEIDEDKCTGCMRCIDVCPVHVIKIL